MNEPVIIFLVGMGLMVFSKTIRRMRAANLQTAEAVEISPKSPA